MKRSTIVVIGENGQLAQALQKRSDPNQVNLHCFGRSFLDLAGPKENITRFLSALPNVDLIINAAAYTAVDKAEEEEKLAHKINAIGPEEIAKFCAKRGIPFIHVSTDYVFDGKSSEPYLPADETNPLGVYGTSKLMGEQKIRHQEGQYAILRTSWVYDGIGNNFFTTMMKLAKTRDEINVVADQFGRPTYALHLADACLKVAEQYLERGIFRSGIYHVSGAGEVIHWAHFAKSIFQMASSHGSNSAAVHEIPSSQYPTPVSRPSYSALDISGFEEYVQWRLPHWERGLDEAFQEWITTTGKE